jgi:hypothetical protein
VVMKSNGHLTSLSHHAPRLLRSTGAASLRPNCLALKNLLSSVFDSPDSSSIIHF